MLIVQGKNLNFLKEVYKFVFFWVFLKILIFCFLKHI